MPPAEEERARAFYGGILGLEEIPKPPELAKQGGLWFRSGEAVIHLGAASDFRPATKAHPAFRCADYDGLVERLRVHGVEVFPGEHLFEGKVHSYISDPFGNRIELIGEKARLWIEIAYNRSGSS